MMYVTDLVELRHRLGITQITMAERMGLSLRAFQDIEKGRTGLREIDKRIRLHRVHELAIERVLIGYAIDRSDPELLGELQSQMTNLIMSEFTKRIGGTVEAKDGRRSTPIKLIRLAS
jgi:transcriptional regulator with XRE-family HTH domain